MEHDPQTDSDAEDVPFADAVRAAIRTVPAGRVVTYGEVAELVGRGGPRQVARVLSLGLGEDDHPDDEPLPWWRVLRADGTPAPHLAARQLALLRAERTPLRPDGLAVDLRRARRDGDADDAPIDHG